jgi:hypothetical protein
MRTTYVAEGSPYLDEQYRLAEITGMNGKVYKNVRVRVNLVEFQVEYLTDDGTEMIATLPVQKVRFPFFTTEGTTSSNYTLQSVEGPMNGVGSTIYQLLDSGRTSLLKEIRITYKDEKKYGEATVTRIFKKKESYFAFQLGKNTRPNKVEKNKSSLLLLLNDKQAQVSTFIDERKLKCKSEADLIAIFNYYNSL